MDMDEATYRVWWQLHLRAARGESLDARERALYEAGRVQVQQTEGFEGNTEKLRESRAVVQALEAEHLCLYREQQKLNVEIAALEAVLDDGTRAKLTK